MEIMQCTGGIKNFDNFDITASEDQINDVTMDFREFDNLYSASIAESEPTRISRRKDKVLLVWFVHCE
jgi:hypothetical protein